MIAPLSILLLAAAASISASPAFTSRAVQKLNEAAFDEAQQRDGTATRAFSNTAIKVRVVINSRHRRLISCLVDFQRQVSLSKSTIRRLPRQPYSRSSHYL